MQPTGSNRHLRLTVLLLAMLCLPALAVTVPRSGQVAVVGSPLRSQADMLALVAGAGGVIVRSGGRANVVVAASEQPGFVWRLYAQGAWLVLDPLVAGACGSSDQGEADAI